jgi:hypothetical protein
MKVQFLVGVILCNSIFIVNISLCFMANAQTRMAKERIFKVNQKGKWAGPDAEGWKM